MPDKPRATGRRGYAALLTGRSASIAFVLVAAVLISGSPWSSNRSCARRRARWGRGAAARGQGGDTDVQSLCQRSLIGTPEQCIEQLLPYVELGVGEFILSVQAPADMRTLELVAQKVASLVKEQGKNILAT